MKCLLNISTKKKEKEAAGHNNSIYIQYKYVQIGIYTTK